MVKYPYQAVLPGLEKLHRQGGEQNTIGELPMTKRGAVLQRSWLDGDYRNIQKKIILNCGVKR